MTGPVILAIDCGGTAVKILAFDLSGREIAHETAAVETTHHPNGQVERDAEALWRAAALAIRAVVAACDGREILALGCTGFGNGIFLVDDSGRPTRPGIVSIDHRAQPLVDDLVAAGTACEIGQTTGNRPWGGQTVMQIAGLARSEPAVVDRTRWALACKDYIRFRLTGEALTDPTDASGGGLIDLQCGGYARSVLDQLGIGHLIDRLAPILPSDAVAGRVTADAAAQTNLPVGLAVAGSMMDVAACVQGAGAAQRPLMTMIAGTWSINCLESAGPAPDQVPILNMRFGQGRLIAEGSPCSAANLTWFLSNAMSGLLSYEDVDALVSNAAVTERRCQFLPYVFGPEPRRGGFIGLGPGDDTGTMVRAIMEGVAFQHLRHANDAVAQVPEAFPDTIRLAGGAARSDVWGQIFADICQREVQRVNAEEVGALGVAICASVACGAHASLEEATDAMTSVRHSHLPDSAHADIYTQRFAEFLRLDAGMVRLPEMTGSDLSNTSNHKEGIR